MDHLRELQGRLFAIVFTFLVIAAAAYPFFDQITRIIIAPLKEGQELVYLTPGGAFSFIIMVCVYVGIVGALPVIIFHLYRFLMPAVRKVHLHKALLYTMVSLVLALVGIAFAYFIMLPASLYFLTSFDLNHINPMLTVDSYFSFVMTYILAGALLFQLPIVMLIINSIKPLTPKKLMHYQGRLLLGSFIVAAVISPTPDALNQTLLALPVVVMYQIGIVVIWLKNRKARRRQAAQKTSAPAPVRQQDIRRRAPVIAVPSMSPVGPVLDAPVTLKTGTITPRPVRSARSLDGVLPPRASIKPPIRHEASTPVPRRALPNMKVVSAQPPQVARSIDGVSVLYRA